MDQKKKKIDSYLYQNPAQNYCPHNKILRKKNIQKNNKSMRKKVYFSAPITTKLTSTTTEDS